MFAQSYRYIPFGPFLALGGAIAMFNDSIRGLFELLLQLVAGAGAVFHSLRSIKNTLGICADIEKYCPDAFLINLSNPMSRVTLAINRGTNVANVGMCHEMPIGIVRIGRLLRMSPSRIVAKASGIIDVPRQTHGLPVDQKRAMGLFERARSSALQSGLGTFLTSFDGAIGCQADKTFESIDVMRSSGMHEIDQAAINIVRMAAPYAPLPDNITEKVVKRLVQVTSAMKQDGENRVGLIRSQTAYKVSQKMAEASLATAE